MKQAIVITAYRDEENLLRLVRHFAAHPAFRIFVHIDRKSRELGGETIRKLQGLGAVALKKYSITWGSIHHVHAVLDLIRLALEDKEIGYFHIVSGADIALHSAEWFARRFEHDVESHFSDGVLPVLERTHTVVWRTKFWMPSTWNPRNNLVNKLNDVAFWLQQKLHFERKRLGELEMAEVRFGMIWSSFARGAAERMLAFEKRHPRFMRALNLTRVPEEAFFVTALMGTPYEPKPDSKDLRFYEWTREMPAVLDERDYEKIKSGDFIFARKIDSKRSVGLIERIKEEGTSCRNGLDSRHRSA